VSIRHAIATADGVVDLAAGLRPLHAGALKVRVLALAGWQIARLALGARQARDAAARRADRRLDRERSTLRHADAGGAQPVVPARWARERTRHVERLG